MDLWHQRVLAVPPAFTPDTPYGEHKERGERIIREGKSKEWWEGISQLNKFGQFVYNPHYFGPWGRRCMHKHWLILDWADKLGAGALARMLQKLLKCKKKYRRGSERRGVRMKKARVRGSEVTHTHARTHTHAQTHSIHAHSHSHARPLTPCRQSLYRLIWPGRAAGLQGHTSKRDGLTNSPWQLINKWQSQSGLTRGRVVHLPQISQGLDSP